MDGTDLEIITRSRGVANGVQNSYANALCGARNRADGRPAASIGTTCPVYAPGMEPPPPGAMEPFAENTPRSNSPSPADK